MADAVLMTEIIRISPIGLKVIQAIQDDAKKKRGVTLSAGAAIMEVLNIVHPELVQRAIKELTEE